MNIELEVEVVEEVERLIEQSDSGGVCFEIGKFIEKFAGAIHLDEQGSAPRSAKEAVDFLIDRSLVTRPLGYKLHVVRELRNVEAHDLEYSISVEDARLAVDTLNQLLEWIHQAETARQWQQIVGLFEEGERLLLDGGGDMSIPALEQAIMYLYDAMHQATLLKIRSLGIPAKKHDLFSAVRTLVDHGLDVRSDGWENLVSVRNHAAHHSLDDGLTDEEIASVKAVIHDLKGVLRKLKPANKRTQMSTDFPTVSWEL